MGAQDAGRQEKMGGCGVRPSIFGPADQPLLEAKPSPALRWLRRLAPVVLAIAAAGCASLGPSVVVRDRSDYLNSIADSWKEQTLLNIVRLRYGDAPSFLEISSLVSSYSVGGQANAGAVVEGGSPWTTGTVSGFLSYQDRPTITYSPVLGDKLAKNLLRPIPPEGVFQLIQAGFPADSVLLVTVRALNGVRNQSLSGGMVQPADPEFYPLLDALRRLQLAGSVGLRLEKRGTDNVGYLILAEGRSPQTEQDLNLVMRTLRLKPGKSGEFVITFSAVPRTDAELAVLSRSMMEVLIELSGGVEVPAKDVSQGRTLASARSDLAAEPRERPLVRIHSGPSAPVHAFAAVRYRDAWYWIDDSDFASKRMYTTLMLFFSMAESGAPAQIPALTIPVQ